MTTSQNLTETQQDTLEELIHDQASQHGSDAVNSGEQEDFLRTHGWTETQIAAAKEGDLDETVHDAASQIASDAINAGDGWDFLLTNGWSAQDIRARIGAE